MTLLQLGYVIELSYYQSFSHTAKKLGISQPALSLQVSRLEEELGMQLFRRTSGKVEATGEGELFIEKARELIQLSENLKNLPFDLEAKPEGELRIGVIPTLAPYWFSMFMTAFSKQYPFIRLTVTELKTEEIITALKTGSLDAGFISTPVEAAGVLFKPLFYEQFFLYVSDRHPLYSYEKIDLDKVDLSEMWYLEEGNCFQNQVDSVCIYAKTPGEHQNMVYLSNSIESLSRIVEQAGGITFIPELATLSVGPEKEQMIKAIAGIVPIREISMVTTRLMKSERLISLFLEHAMSVIPRRMLKDDRGKAIPAGIKV